MGVLDDAIREHLELKRRHGTSEEELRRQETEALGPARREPLVRERPEGALEGREAPFAATGETELEPPLDEDQSLAHEAFGEQGLAQDLGTEPGLEPDVAREPSLEAVERSRPPHGLDEEHDADDERLGDEVPAGESLEQDPGLPPRDPGEPAPGTEALAGVEPPAAGEPTVRPFDVEELEPETGDDREFHAEPAGEPTTPAAAASDDDAFAQEEELLDEEELAEEELAAELAGGDDAVEPEFAAEQPPPAEGEPSAEDVDEDVLEETPEFLQETPEDERLWFEQKPPRDFDLDR